MIYDVGQIFSASIRWWRDPDPSRVDYSTPLRLSDQLTFRSSLISVNNPRRWLCVNNTAGLLSSSMNRNRSSGYSGSSGTYAPPAFITARSPQSFRGYGPRIRLPACLVSLPMPAGNALAGWLDDSNHHSSIPALRIPPPQRSVSSPHALRTMLQWFCRADSLSSSLVPSFQLLPSLPRSAMAGSTHAASGFSTTAFSNCS